MSRGWHALAAVTFLVGLTAGACSDDDAGPATDDASSSVPSITTTSRVAAAGGLDIPEIEGTFPVPVPSLGFGIAVPDGWFVTLLSDEALDRVAQAALAEPFVLESARKVASTGAVLYGAGIDTEGRVAELKIDVQRGADTSPEAVQTFADGLVASGAVGDDAEVVEGDDGRIRVVYRLELASAEDGSPIDALGSQLFVPDGDRLWSVLASAEDATTLAAIVDVFEASFVVDDS